MPGSAIRSRDSGQRILGGSKSAHREEREWGNPWGLGLGYQSWASSLVLSDPRDAVHSLGTLECQHRVTQSQTSVACASPCFGTNSISGSSKNRGCRSWHLATVRSDVGVIPVGTPGMERGPPLRAPAVWGWENSRVRIYLHRLARSRSSARPPCRCGSGHPPAGSQAGRCSHSGNPSARRLSTRRCPAALQAARGTVFLGWREQKGEGSIFPTMLVGRVPRPGCRRCPWGCW